MQLVLNSIFVIGVAVALFVKCMYLDAKTVHQKSLWNLLADCEEESDRFSAGQTVSGPCIDFLRDVISELAQQQQVGTLVGGWPYCADLAKQSTNQDLRQAFIAWARKRERRYGRLHWFAEDQIKYMVLDEFPCK